MSESDGGGFSFELFRKRRLAAAYASAQEMERWSRQLFNTEQEVGSCRPQFYHPNFCSCPRAATQNRTHTKDPLRC